MKEIISNTGPVNLAISGVFIISLLTQLYYYLFVFARACRKSPDLSLSEEKLPPVSVIICARNEAENLENKLGKYLEQDYPEFEIIVVNDRSEDATEEVLDSFKKKYKNLKTSKVTGDPKLIRTKKFALTLGIKSASFGILLLSDADCEPAGPDWIRYMVRNYNENISLVLGVGLYKRKKGLVNMLVRFEAAFIAMQYISLARKGKAYMGVGRNLSYRKEIFFRNKGFASHLKLESGDDDLLVNEIATGNNTGIETHPGSFTYSEQAMGFAGWARQKRRHLTTARYYQSGSKRILGAEYLTRMSLILSFLFLIINSVYPTFVLTSFAFLFLVKGIIFKFAFNRLSEKFLFLPALVIEPLIPWFYGILHILNYIARKRSRWN